MTEERSPRHYGFLNGARVVDCSASLMGAYATQLVAGYGAEVTSLRIDELLRKGASPFADTHLRERPYYAPYLARHKAEVSVDLDSEDAVEQVRALVAAADVVVVDHQRDSGSRAVGIVEDAAADADTIVVRLSPYGDGDRNDRRASDLTMYHGGGPGFATPGLVADPATMAPLRPRSHQAHMVSGLTASISIVSALMQKRRDVGRVGVDFSAYEAMANLFRQNLATYAYHAGGVRRELAKGRGAGGTADQRNLPCQDGHVNLSYASAKHWEALRAMLEEPEWMNDELFATPALRYRNWAAIYERLSEWLSTRAKSEVFILAQAFGIPCAPLNTASEILSEPVLEARDFWDRSGGRCFPAGPALITRFAEEKG